MRAVIYSRVSTGLQAEKGTSLEDQVAMCTREAEKIGAEVFAHYQDAGVSGALYLTRPGIQDALRAIEDKRADVLIIHSISRGGRMVEGVRAIASRLFHVGGRLFIAGRGEVGLEGTDKALLTMEATFAEMEREQIRERTTAGKVRQAIGGQMPARAMHPYGYHIVTKADVIRGEYPEGSEGTFTIIQNQREVAYSIFEDCAKGKSIRGIGFDLERRMIPNGVGKVQWSRGAIQGILRNPVYMGCAHYGRTTTRMNEGRLLEGKGLRYSVKTADSDVIRIPAPAIISEALWDACCTRLSTNRERLSGGGRKYFMTGLLRCFTCERAMTPKVAKGAGKMYYFCQHSCPHPYLIAADVERDMWKILSDILCNPGCVSTQLVRSIVAEGDVEAERLRLLASLTAVEDKQDSLIDMRLEAARLGQGVDRYLKKAIDLDAERERIESALSELPTPKIVDAASAGDKVSICLSAVADIFTSPDRTPDDRHDTIGAVIHSFSTDGRGSYRIKTQPLECLPKGYSLQDKNRGVLFIKISMTPSPSLSSIQTR
jgi:site-specific DNA recombinase